MKNLSSKLTLVLTALMLSVWSGGAYAKCKAPKSPDELTIEDLQAIYECIGPKLQDGYAGKGNAWAKEYPNWKAASNAPAAPVINTVISISSVWSMILTKAMQVSIHCNRCLPATPSY